MTKQYKKDYFEDRKLKYEKNHGVFVHEFMFTEFSNKILGQCNIALNDLQRQLDLEIARAKAEEKRLDSKIDAEINRATGRENELAASINACLPKVGGTMEDCGVIKWNHEEQNPHANPFILGGLEWNGATDYLSIKGEITGDDNMNLAINLGDDNSNAIVIKDKDNAEVASIHSDGVYTGTIEWSHINNRPEIDKQPLDNVDSYTLNDQLRLIKNDQKTKLMSNYNSTLMNIAQAINMHTQAIKDLRTDLNKLQGINQGGHVE